MTLITSHPLALMKPGLSTCFYELFFFFFGGGGSGKDWLSMYLFSSSLQPARLDGAVIQLKRKKEKPGGCGGS